MAEKNYYEVLGVAQTATQEEIKKAYEQLRLKNYPTSNPKSPYAATAKLNELFEAYKVLSDTDKRQAYNAPLAATGKTLSDWSGKHSVVNDLWAFSFIGRRYKVRKIKSTHTVKLGAIDANTRYHFVCMILLFAGLIFGGETTRIARGFWRVERPDDLDALTKEIYENRLR